MIPNDPRIEEAEGRRDPAGGAALHRGRVVTDLTWWQFILLVTAPIWLTIVVGVIVDLITGGRRL